jgi:hypothetical protein
MSDKMVEKKYVNAGAQVGDAISYIHINECTGFDLMLNTLADWEQEYAGREYRTVPMDDFLLLGGYGRSIESSLGQKLEKNEEPIFHAQIKDNLIAQ